MLQRPETGEHPLGQRRPHRGDRLRPVQGGARGEDFQFLRHRRVHGAGSGQQVVCQISFNCPYLTL